MDRRCQALKKVFRVLREGRTQKEIAEKAGLAESKVSLYATGKQYPSPNNLAKLAKGLGCQLEQLERAIVLAQAEPELGDNPPKLRARIGLGYIPDDAPGHVPAAEPVGPRYPIAHELSEHMSRVEEGMRSIEEGMKLIGEGMKSFEEGMRSIEHELIELSTRVSPPAPPPGQDV